MRIELRQDSVLIDGYVNAVGRDSRPMRDRNGEQFIEQIVPGAFAEALERANEVKILLNHNEERILGSTKTNLKLTEDNIGLRAIAEITDAEVVEKAREKKLRGWSFGFIEREASEEELKNGIKHRFVEGLELKEVSIIDERKLPCYTATSIETRAGEQTVFTRATEFEADYIGFEDKKQPVNFSNYKERIAKLGGKI